MLTDQQSTVESTRARVNDKALTLCRKISDVRLRRQVIIFRYLKQMGNKTVSYLLLGKQSDNCSSIVEKIWENVTLGLWPLATVSLIFSDLTT